MADTTGKVGLLHITSGTTANATIDIAGDLGALKGIRRRGKLRWIPVGFWSGDDINASITAGGYVLDFVVEGQTNADFTAGSIGRATLAQGLAAGADLVTAGDVEHLMLGGIVAGDIDVGGHLGNIDIGYYTIFRRRGKRRTIFHDATFTGTLRAGSMGTANCHATSGLQGTVTVAGDLGALLKVKRKGRKRWVPFGLYIAGDVNADIMVGGKAVLIDIRGDLVDASINRTPGPAAELEDVIVAGRIRSAAPQWVRANIGTFKISDITWSGTVRAGAPHVFGNVTAQIG